MIYCQACFAVSLVHLFKHIRLAQTVLSCSQSMNNILTIYKLSKGVHL